MKDEYNKKILIAANDKEIAEDLANNLKNLNYEVIGFADSRSEAAIKTGQLKPDIVLMDLELPGDAENVDAAALIKKNYSIPIVFIKTHLDDDTIPHSDKSEPYGYIIKPVNKGILHAVVSTALRLHDSDKKLYEKNQMYNAILNIPRESLSLIEPDGTILEVNESFIRHFNKNREELIGHSIYDLFPFEIAEQKKLIVGEVMLNGKTTFNEFEHNGKWLSNIIFPIFDISGVIVKIGISSLDITGYKQAKDKNLFDVIFLPGFSTNEEITDISGRGVGMDVVSATIKSLGGTVYCESQEGKGSEITLIIPMAMGVSVALIVEADTNDYAIPFENVIEVIKIAPESIMRLHDRKGIIYRNESLPIEYLQKLLFDSGIEKKSDYNQYRKTGNEEVIIAILQTHNGKLGIIVDSLKNNMQISIKPVPEQLAGISVINGVSITGDGRVMLVLNPNKLIK